MSSEFYVCPRSRRLIEDSLDYSAVAGKSKDVAFSSKTLWVMEKEEGGIACNGRVVYGFSHKIFIDQIIGTGSFLRVVPREVICKELREMGFVGVCLNLAPAGFHDGIFPL